MSFKHNSKHFWLYSHWAFGSVGIYDTGNGTGNPVHLPNPSTAVKVGSAQAWKLLGNVHMCPSQCQSMYTAPVYKVTLCALTNLNFQCCVFQLIRAFFDVHILKKLDASSSYIISASLISLLSVFSLTLVLKCVLHCFGSEL